RESGVAVQGRRSEDGPLTRLSVLATDLGCSRASRTVGRRFGEGQAFAEELRIVNGTGVPFRYFFGAAGSGRRYDVRPHHLVREPETLTVGGTRFVLYPARGGETADALIIHVPDRGALFVGDAFMPCLGAP